MTSTALICIAIGLFIMLGSMLLSYVRGND